MSPIRGTIRVEYAGNLQGLVEFLEANFKDPSTLTLNVTAAHEVKRGKTALETLADECLRSMSGTTPNAREELLKSFPEALEAIRGGAKIQAIKILRTATNCGIREAKDAVDGPIQVYIDRGGV